MGFGGLGIGDWGLGIGKIINLIIIYQLNNKIYY
jgi:hypothetical protein